MRKSASQVRRVAKPCRLSPVLAPYIPALMAAIPREKALPSRQLLVRKTWLGTVVSRYRDGYEIAFSDGRVFSAKSPWGLVLNMFKGITK